MAVFKVAKDEYNRPKLYSDPADLFSLIYYVHKKSICRFTNRLVDIDAETVAYQILAAQHCYGSNLHHRALHFILSYATSGCEWEMNADLVARTVYDVTFCMDQFKLYEYQYLIGVHDNGNNCHLHIIINPVNMETGKILHYGIFQYQRFLKELAKILYSKYRIALEPVSYINENGRLKFDNRGVHLYENITCIDDSHLKLI